MYMVNVVLAIIIDIIMAPLRVFMREVIGLSSFKMFYGCVLMQGISIGGVALLAYGVENMGVVIVAAIISNLVANNLWAIFFYGKKAFPSFCVRKRLTNRLYFQAMLAYDAIKSI